MYALIGRTLLADAKSRPRSKPFEIYDTRLSGFTLRVQPSGAQTYYARYGRNRRFRLGRVGSVTPEVARANCQRLLGNIAGGRHPLEGLAGAASGSLGKFMADVYAPWAQANRPRTGKSTAEKVRCRFGSWYAEPLSAISVERLELWKARRLRSGASPTTVIRELFALSSVLSRAVRVGRLDNNPIRKVEKPRIDRRPRIRYLNASEESRLRAALQERDRAMIQRRLAANRKRSAQRRPLLPALPHFGNHLTPAVLLTLNTGMRLGEVLKLRWGDIDFSRRWLTVEGRTSKTRQTRHIPLNAEAFRVLSQWREQCESSSRVFDVSTSFKTAWRKLLEPLGIVDFRWHDLRHHFASRLVQAGVPLNTVRDLLGHSSIAMTLRYAHLAPDQRCEAVALLDEKPVLNVRLQLPRSDVAGVLPAVSLQPS